MSEDYSYKNFDNSKCPNCENKDENKIQSRNSQEDGDTKVAPIPIDCRAICGNCGNRDNPGAFEWEYKKEDLSEDKIKKIKQKQEEWHDKMAEASYDADHLADEREDANRGYST